MEGMLVAVVDASEDADLLGKLEQRKVGPPAQRALFVTESAGTDAVAHLAKVVAAAPAAGITIVSANVYYGRCVATTKGREEAVDPAKTMAAIGALIAGGADIICLQEVPGGAAPEGQGKDAYPDLGDFDKDFPKASFDQWPEELAKLGAQDGVHIIYAPARNSTMYRCSFGNALVINTATLRVDESSLTVQDCLTEPTEQEGFEGRSAVTVVVEPVGGGAKLAVCCTHLTEKQIGEQGQKQCEMIEALLTGTLADPRYADLPTVLCGDFNINDVGAMPPESAAYCNSSPFLHPHTEHDPYARLTSVGFTSSQHYAQQEGTALNTCWNAGIVDYNGSRGAVRPLAVGILDPTHDGHVIADHRWPVAVYTSSL
jgi:endonuclease/exonuclease/phosphatase family metal-dependent hydrolase